MDSAVPISWELVEIKAKPSPATQPTAVTMDR
jgi:hypothetical protein